MPWLIVLALVLMAALFPPVRKLMLSMALVVGVAIGGLMYLTDLEQKRQLTRMAHGDVQIAGGRFQRGGQGGRFLNTARFEARLRNLSPDYALDTLGLTFQFWDCPSANATRASCDLIGQDTCTRFVNIPPGQTRELSCDLRLPTLSTENHFDWDYQVTLVKAK